MPPEILPEEHNRKPLIWGALIVVLITLLVIYWQVFLKNTAPLGLSVKQDTTVLTQVERDRQIELLRELIPPATTSQANVDKLTASIPKQTTFTEEQRNTLLQSIPPPTLQ